MPGLAAAASRELRSTDGRGRPKPLESIEFAGIDGAFVVDGFYPAHFTDAANHGIADGDST